MLGGMHDDGQSVPEVHRVTLGSFDGAGSQFAGIEKIVLDVSTERISRWCRMDAARETG
jgi:hypothetical protein